MGQIDQANDTVSEAYAGAAAPVIPAPKTAADEVTYLQALSMVARNEGFLRAADGIGEVARGIQEDNDDGTVE